MVLLLFGYPTTNQRQNYFVAQTSLMGDFQNIDNSVTMFIIIRLKIKIVCTLYAVCMQACIKPFSCCFYSFAEYSGPGKTEKTHQTIQRRQFSFITRFINKDKFTFEEGLVYYQIPSISLLCCPSLSQSNCVSHNKTFPVTQISLTNSNYLYKFKTFQVVFGKKIHNLKGDAGNPIVNTVLPHDIFQDWVWLLQGKERKKLIFACFASLKLNNMVEEVCI